MSEEPGVVTSSIDFAAIETLVSLQDENDPGLVKDLIQLFLNRAPELVTQLEVILKTSGDLKNAEKLAHDLKASSATLGAIRLSELCAAIESHAAAQDTVSIIPLVIDIKSELHKVKGCLGRILGSMPLASSATAH